VGAGKKETAVAINNYNSAYEVQWWDKCIELQENKGVDPCGGRGDQREIPRGHWVTWGVWRMSRRRPEQGSCQQYLARFGLPFFCKLSILGF
jgi:hypothetical protein